MAGVLGIHTQPAGGVKRVRYALKPSESLNLTTDDTDCTDVGGNEPSDPANALPGVSGFISDP
jgi:hypothetical protein